MVFDPNQPSAFSDDDETIGTPDAQYSEAGGRAFAPGLNSDTSGQVFETSLWLLIATGFAFLVWLTIF